jgi:hypothetical protein
VSANAFSLWDSELTIDNFGFVSFAAFIEKADKNHKGKIPSFKSSRMHWLLDAAIVSTSLNVHLPSSVQKQLGSKLYFLSLYFSCHPACAQQR